MYAGDAPLAERRAQALTLDRELLAASRQRRPSRVLDPEAIALWSWSCRVLLPERFPRDPDEGHDLLVRLVTSPRRRRSPGHLRDWLRALERERRAVSVRLPENRAGSPRRCGRYREASEPVFRSAFRRSSEPRPGSARLPVAALGANSRPFVTADPDHAGSSFSRDRSGVEPSRLTR